MKTARLKARDERDRKRRYRALHGRRQLAMQLRADSAAALIYLRKQWGITSNAEVVHIALVRLSRETRDGLRSLEL